MPVTSLGARAPQIRKEIAALWHLAWPILVGQLASAGMAVSDLTMAGHASAGDLAGVALGVSVWNIITLTVMGVMMSVNPTVAHLVGAKAWDKIAPVMRQAIWKALLLGGLASVVAYFCTHLFDAMRIEPQVRHVATRFVQITSFAMPAFACYRALYGYSTSLNQTRPLMAVALGALALNVCVNAVLVFGLWGAPRLGGVGCAWSTLLCVWFNLLGVLLWMCISPAFKSTWPLRQWSWPQGAELHALFKLGLPIGVTYFAEVSAFGLIALLIAQLGATEVGANQIALNFSSLAFMTPLSWGMALLTRVGQSLGAGDLATARLRAWIGVAAGWVFALCSACAIALLSQPIARAYTSDVQVAHLAAQLLIWAAIFQLPDATQVITSCAIRGYKITRPPMLLHLTAFWLVCLPLGYCLGIAPAGWWGVPAHALGAQGFWIALVAGLSIAALGLVAMLYRITHRHRLPTSPP